MMIITLKCNLIPGQASRKCVQLTTGAVWQEPNFNGCVDPPFEMVNEEVTRIEEGIGSDNATKYKDTAKKIESLTASRELLTPGNVKSSTKAVAKLAEVRQSHKEVKIEREETQAVVDAVSHLLDEENLESWKSIQEEAPEESVLLMDAVDRYGQTLAEQLGEKADEPSEEPGEDEEDTVTIQSPNICRCWQTFWNECSSFYIHRSSS